MGRDRRLKAWVSAGLSFAMTVPVWAQGLSRDEAERVAVNFVQTDEVGSCALSGRRVASVEAWRALWVARLAPSGYVVVAGSDHVDPIVAFSERDFVEPPEGEAFHGVLNGASIGCEAAETVGRGATLLSVRLPGPSEEVAARWARLRGGHATVQGLVADLGTSSVVVSPFLMQHWHQWQPFNDFMPVGTQMLSPEWWPYRGRAAAGCSMVVAAQIFAHWRWPVRLDHVWTTTHEYAVHGPEQAPVGYPIRFDGHLPLDWDACADEYDSVARQDLRGLMAEGARTPIARLLLLCNSLGESSLARIAEGGTAAYFSRIAANSPWYERPVALDVRADPVEARRRIRESLCGGCPVALSIPSHSVIAHGWAEDGSAAYVYVNYGYAGQNDGWYNLADTTSSAAILEAFVGFRPKKTVQVDPLACVGESARVELTWHLPPCHENAPSAGFRIEASRQGIEPFDWEEDFTSDNGTATGSMSVRTVSGIDNDTSVLRISSSASSGSYTLPNTVTLTARSVLSFDVLSSLALGQNLAVQARFSQGEWQTVATCALLGEAECARWKTIRAFVGDHGGESAQFRVTSRIQGYYYDEGNVYLDNLKVSDVLQAGIERSVVVPPSSRSCVLEDLEPGALYAFTVTPLMEGGVASEAVTQRMAGPIREFGPGAETLGAARTFSFTRNDDSQVWAIAGTPQDATSIASDPWGGGFFFLAPGPLTKTSKLTFKWTARGYYSKNRAYDVLTARFVEMNGRTTELWTKTNTANKTSKQTVSIDLAALEGRRGEICVEFVHEGAQYASAGYGVTFYTPQVAGVCPAVPPEEGMDEAVSLCVAEEAPRICAVTSSRPLFDGNFRECARGRNVFYVRCSPSVTEVAAFPSHLALVGDEDVSVQVLGDGLFAVTVDASGISADEDRSRLIVTLRARNANGTAVYRDLTLRFSSETAERGMEDDEVVSEGDVSVAVPREWFEQFGLVGATLCGGGATGASAIGRLGSVALADSDQDGLANWKEWVCGTNPTNAADRLRCSLRLENGRPVVDYEPKTLQPGFDAVLKGARTLWDPAWEDAVDGHRFFKIVLRQR